MCSWGKTDGLSKQAVPEAVGLEKCMPLVQGEEEVKRCVAAGSLVRANWDTLTPEEG